MEGRKVVARVARGLKNGYDSNSEVTAKRAVFVKMSGSA